MNRKKQLEQLLEDCKKAENALITKIGDAMTMPDTTKVRLWNEVTPFVKSAVESVIREGGHFDHNSLKENCYRKLMMVICGENVFELLDKITARETTIS